MSHWIIAPVVLPAMVAPLIVLGMRNDIVQQRIFGLLATAVLAAIAAGWVAVIDAPRAYFLGDWPAPFGIVLVMDRLSAAMLALTAFLALAVQVHAAATGWDAKGRHFHALWLFQLMGLNGAFLTGDAFTLFVFFEVLLIASYGLMIHGGGTERLRAGVQYVGVNLVGSTLFLFGLATIFSVTGTLNMADIGQRLAELPEGEAALVRVAGAMLLCVFAVKGALVPFQFWLPGTYANSPGPVAALFAVMTKVGAYAVLRIFTISFPQSAPAVGSFYADLLWWAALVTMLLGAVGVVGARSLMRQAAFAGIASMGTLFVALAAFTPAAATAALYYLLTATLAGAMLFLVADLMTARRGSDSLDTARPAFPQSGLLAALFMAGAVATAGLPPLSGFLAKLLVLDAWRGAGMAAVWTVVLAASLLVTLGLARAGSQVFWKTAPPEDAHPPGHPPQPWAMAAELGLLAGQAALTVLAGPVHDWLSLAVQGLFDPSAYRAAVFGHPLYPAGGVP
jgi:multicomponent K+:H+ antiporter subunit D